MITNGIRSLAEFDISTTWGTLSVSLAAQSGYLLSLEITSKGQSVGSDVLTHSSHIADIDRPLFRQIQQELIEYFSGWRRQFSLPLNIDQLPGTDFQKQVWARLRQIPYGETQTYGQIASALGRPTAARAVGQAVHRNPILLLIPCHRVIGSNGQLTGFRAGLPLKQYLLSRENNAPPDLKKTFATANPPASGGLSARCLLY